MKTYFKNCKKTATFLIMMINRSTGTIHIFGEIKTLKSERYFLEDKFSLENLSHYFKLIDKDYVNANQVNVYDINNL